MLIDNTVAMGNRVSYETPQSYLRQRGLMGLGTSLPTTDAFPDMDKILTSLNAEALFLLNLDRARQGLPPIDVRNAAPRVNFGVTPEVQNMLLLGAAGLGLLFLLKRR